jgi:adenine-specific DNA-methyltransferase
MIAGRDRILRIPASAAEETALERVESWKGSLAAYGLKISTGPVVAFRATKWLRQDAANDTVPLLWLNHVFSMETHWPNGVRKPQYIDLEAAREKLLLPNRNYVVMRRFSAKEDARRLTAAPLIAKSISARQVGLENHLNYVYRPGGSLTDDEAWGLAALYSSSLLDAYFRCVNGNTQVSATELRTMPLPALAQIVLLGKRVRKASKAMAVVDELVEEVIGG